MTTNSSVTIVAQNLTFAQYQTLLNAVKAFATQHPEITSVTGQFVEND